jgi:GNAT superfamily N-acetyltransferase
MAADLPSLNDDLPMPLDLVVEEVNDAETLMTWCQISSEVLELPPFTAEAWSGIFASVPFGPGKVHRHYLARLGGVPVGTSSVYYGAGVAGISSVATVPEARRKGVGSAVTLEPLKEARRLGYRIATLFSSEMAVSMYQKLGFKEYCRCSLYLWIPAPLD